MENKYKQFKRILTNSHSFDLDCDGVLTVTDYYTGAEVTIDLYGIDLEMFEQLVVDDE